jgi:hypothetical protein
VFGYAVAFVVLADPLLSGLFLLLSGLFATLVLVAVGYRLGDVDPVTTTWAVLLVLAGALGSAVHGGYDLANALHPPTGGVGDLPNAVDPRGLLTFGLAGIGLVVVGVVILRTRRLPRPLGYLACVNGALQIELYVGRLVVLDPSKLLILLPAALPGFVTNPLFYGACCVMAWLRRAYTVWGGACSQGQPPSFGGSAPDIGGADAP